MNNTGKKRNPKDNFYTKKEISLTCINNALQLLSINISDLIIEPSAGDGSFSDYFKNNDYKIKAYDIDPKKEYIEKCNFLEINNKIFSNNNNKVHTIGNPPFGLQSSLAKKFIKKCSDFSDSISFILPKSFRKSSYQSAFPLHFHLEKEYELDSDIFLIDGKAHKVPCIFQIWVKKDTKRYIEEKENEYGFKFIKKPEVTILEKNDEGRPIKKKNIFIENPDFGILRAGGGKKCGRISLNWEDGIKCYEQGWLFIKIDDKYDKDKFYEGYKKIDWTDDSNVGAKSISKPIFIKGINKLLKSMD
jgi:hypothetical protein